MKTLPRLFIVTLITVISLSAYAQKIKVAEGSLKPLKNEKSINIEFKYDGMSVGKFSKEEDYIEKRKSEMNSKEPGSGDKWATSWISDRKDAYEPKFIKLFTEHSSMKIEPEAKYTLIFHTKTMEPGYNVGVWRGNAYIDAIATVVETANQANTIAIIDLKDVKGKMPMGTDFATSWRIAESYARAGREIAQLIK